MGRSARRLLAERAAELKARLRADALVVNGENAAAGFGITGKIADAMFEVGVDVVTTGNHVWDQREVVDYIAKENRLLRPVNFPKDAPGGGSVTVTLGDGRRLLVVNVMGQVFMGEVANPFEAMAAVLEKHALGRDCDGILVDMHAEASSEKMAMGYFCDGRVSMVIGTHCHVPTADARVLPGGTAYQSDAGMCGDYESIIGMQKDEPLRRFVHSESFGGFTPALGAAMLCGVLVELEAGGLARRIAPVRVGAVLRETIPEWAEE